MNADRDDRDERGSPARRDRRHRAREAALQMLYQWEVGRTSIEEVVESYWSIDRPGEAALSPPLRSLATMLASGTVQHVADIDPIVAAQAEHWRLSRMAIIDHLILRLAVFEFLYSPDVPRKVVINEAIELARTFSSDDAVKFVNGVLDGINKRLETQDEP